ncbi:MAG: hypothetical protein WDW38_006606 [Sanguina aurantia]
MKMVTMKKLACALVGALAASTLGSGIATAQAAAAASAAAAPIAARAAARISDDNAFRYFDTYYFPTNPTTATADGLHAFDSKLEDYSRAGVDANVTALLRWESRLAGVDPARLTERVRGDRELVLNNIRSTLLTLRTIKPWQKNPDVYSSGITNSAFTLMERKFAPPETRARSTKWRRGMRRMPAARGRGRARPRQSTTTRGTLDNATSSRAAGAKTRAAAAVSSDVSQLYARCRR